MTGFEAAHKEWAIEASPAAFAVPHDMEARAIPSVLAVRPWHLHASSHASYRSAFPFLTGMIDRTAPTHTPWLGIVDRGPQGLIGSAQAAGRHPFDDASDTVIGLSATASSTGWFKQYAMAAPFALWQDRQFASDWIDDILDRRRHSGVMFAELTKKRRHDTWTTAIDTALISFRNRRHLYDLTQRAKEQLSNAVRKRTHQKDELGTGQSVSEFPHLTRGPDICWSISAQRSPAGPVEA